MNKKSYKKIDKFATYTFFNTLKDETIQPYNLDRSRKFFKADEKSHSTYSNTIPIPNDLKTDGNSICSISMNDHNQEKKIENEYKRLEIDTGNSFINESSSKNSLETKQPFPILSVRENHYQSADKVDKKDIFHKSYKTSTNFRSTKEGLSGISPSICKSVNKVSHLENKFTDIIQKSQELEKITNKMKEFRNLHITDRSLLETHSSQGLNSASKKKDFKFYKIDISKKEPILTETTTYDRLSLNNSQSVLFETFFKMDQSKDICRPVSIQFPQNTRDKLVIFQKEKDLLQNNLKSGRFLSPNFSPLNRNALYLQLQEDIQNIQTPYTKILNSSGIKSIANSTRSLMNMKNGNKSSFSLDLNNNTYINSLRKDVPCLFSDKPSGRQEVINLGNWLIKTLKEIEETRDMQNYDKYLQADMVYNICLNELIRQVSIECLERGELIMRIWKSYLNLMEDIVLELKNTEKLTEQKCDGEYNLQHDTYEIMLKQKDEKYKKIINELNDYKIEYNEMKKQNNNILEMERAYKNEIFKLKYYLGIAKKDNQILKQENQNLVYKYNKIHDHMNDIKKEEEVNNQNAVDNKENHNNGDDDYEDNNNLIDIQHSDFGLIKNKIPTLVDNCTQYDLEMGNQTTTATQTDNKNTEITNKKRPQKDFTTQTVLELINVKYNRIFYNMEKINRLLDDDISKFKMINQVELIENLHEDNNVPRTRKISKSIYTDEDFLYYESKSNIDMTKKKTISLVKNEDYHNDHNYAPQKSIRTNPSFFKKSTNFPTEDEDKKSNSVDENMPKETKIEEEKKQIQHSQTNAISGSIIEENKMNNQIDEVDDDLQNLEPGKNSNRIENEDSVPSSRTKQKKTHSVESNAINQPQKLMNSNSIKKISKASPKHTNQPSLIFSGKSKQTLNEKKFISNKILKPSNLVSEKLVKNNMNNSGNNMNIVSSLSQIEDKNQDKITVTNHTKKKARTNEEELIHGPISESPNAQTTNNHENSQLQPNKDVLLSEKNYNINSIGSRSGLSPAPENESNLVENNKNSIQEITELASSVASLSENKLKKKVDDEEKNEDEMISNANLSTKLPRNRNISLEKASSKLVDDQNQSNEIHNNQSTTKKMFIYTQEDFKSRKNLVDNSANLNKDININLETSTQSLSKIDGNMKQKPNSLKRIQDEENEMIEENIEKYQGKNDEIDELQRSVEKKLIKMMKMYKVEKIKYEHALDLNNKLEMTLIEDGNLINNLKDIISKLRNEYNVSEEKLLNFEDLDQKVKIHNENLQKINELKLNEANLNQLIALNEDDNQDSKLFIDDLMDNKAIRKVENKPVPKNDDYRLFYLNIAKKIAQEKKCPAAIILISRLRKRELSRMRDIIPVKSLLKQIYQFYHEKITLSKENPSLKDQDMGIYIYKVFLNTYGLKKFAERKFIKFCLSVKKYIMIPRITQFARMCGLCDIDTMNLTINEQQIYLNAIDYIQYSNNIGVNVDMHDYDKKIYVPYVRCADFIKYFFEKRCNNLDEYMEIKKEFEKIKEIDPLGFNKNGIIDIDLFADKLIIQYKTILERHSENIKCIFIAGDFLYNKRVHYITFDMLYKYIENEKYEYKKIQEIFYNNVDIIDNDDSWFSFQKFLALTLEHDLFLPIKQYKFMGIYHNSTANNNNGVNNNTSIINEGHINIGINTVVSNNTANNHNMSISSIHQNNIGGNQNNSISPIIQNNIGSNNNMNIGSIVQNNIGSNHNMNTSVMTLHNTGANNNIIHNSNGVAGNIGNNNNSNNQHHHHGSHSNSNNAVNNLNFNDEIMKKYDEIKTKWNDKKNKMNNALIENKPGYDKMLITFLKYGLDQLDQIIINIKSNNSNIDLIKASIIRYKILCAELKLQDEI